MVSNTCKQCGQVFFRSGTKTFCGRPCFERWYSINMKGRGPNNRGNRIVKPNGYVHLWMPAHQRATKQGYVREHIVIAEKALGKSLPPGTEVHHVNEKPGDNKPSNLVICENHAYHLLLHVRTRALRRRQAGGKSCRRCGELKPENAFYTKKYATGSYLTSVCRQCTLAEQKVYRNSVPA